MQGDRSYIAHLDIMKTFWNSKPNCHVKNPIGCVDAQNKQGFWNYLGAQYELKYSQYLQNNDDCMKRISEYKYYWELLRPMIIEELNNFQGSISLYLTSASIIGLSLLF